MYLTCVSLSPGLYKPGEVFLRTNQLNGRFYAGNSICLDGLCKSRSKIMSSVINEHPQSSFCSRQHKFCTQTSRRLSPRMRSHQSLYPLAFALQHLFFFFFLSYPSISTFARRCPSSQVAMLPACHLLPQ